MAKAGSQELQGELVLDGKNSEFRVFDFEQVLEATNDFSDENKLGEGGFGAVYKVNYLGRKPVFFSFMDYVTISCWKMLNQPTNIVETILTFFCFSLFYFLRASLLTDWR